MPWTRDFGAHRDRMAGELPGLRVSGMIGSFLSAFAENHGRKPMDEMTRWTRRSSESEGGCFGGFRRRNEGNPWRQPAEASW